jgi:hypothetical protein
VYHYLTDKVFFKHEYDQYEIRDLIAMLNAGNQHVKQQTGQSSGILRVFQAYALAGKQINPLKLRRI